MDRSRLEAFSDGVFAVAITLLALDLAVAGPGHGRLLHQLGSHWPAFVAYLISFFTIGIIWVNHHVLMQNVALVNRTLLFLNLLLLAFVVALPFGTATMADYLTAGGQDAHVAMAMYGAILEGMSFGFMTVFEWTLREDRVHRPVPERTRWAARTRFYAGQLAYLLAIGVAFVSPYLALAIIGLVAAYYVFERTPAPDHAAPDGTAPDGTAANRTPATDHAAANPPGPATPSPAAADPATANPATANPATPSPAAADPTATGRPPGRMEEG